jgi:hypothetical protein
MVFEPTTSVFRQVKTVHALDRAATVIGTSAAICDIGEGIEVNVVPHSLNSQLAG